MDFKPKVSNVSKGLNDRGTWVLSVNHKGLHPSEGRDVRASAERKLLFFGNVTHYLCFFKHTEIQPEKVPARRKIMGTHRKGSLSHTHTPGELLGDQLSYCTKILLARF